MEEEGRLLTFSILLGGGMLSPHTDACIVPASQLTPAQVSPTLWVRGAQGNDGGGGTAPHTGPHTNLSPEAAFQLKEGFEIFAVGGRLKSGSQPPRNLEWESCFPSYLNRF